METGVVALSIGQIVSIIALGVSIYFNSKNAKKSDVSESVETAKAMTEMNMTLKSVAKNVEVIMTELCDTKDIVADHTLRISIAESGLKDTAREVNELRVMCNELSSRVMELIEKVAKITA